MHALLPCLQGKAATTPAPPPPQDADSSGKTLRTGASKSVSLKKVGEELVEVTPATSGDVEFNGTPAEVDAFFDMLGVVNALVSKPFCFSLSSVNRRRDVYRIAHKLLHQAKMYADDLEPQASAYVTHDAIEQRLGITAPGEVDTLLHGFRSLAAGPSRKRTYEACDTNGDKENVKYVLPDRVLAALVVEFGPEVKAYVQANKPMQKVRSWV